MNLNNKILEDWKQAMKDKEQDKKTLLSTVRAEIKNKSIAKKETLADSDIHDLLRKMVKQRLETVSLVKESSPETADKELWEADMLKAYLPQMMPAEGVREAVGYILKGKTYTQADFGKAMQECMKHLKGKADGKTVQFAVKEYLA